MIPEKKSNTSPDITVYSAAIIEAVKAVKGLVIDDHGNGASTIQLSGVATLDKGKSSKVVALFEDTHFSLNEVHLDKAGTPHLSIDSVAGILNCRGGVKVKDAIELYNKIQATTTWSCGKLNNVTML